MRLVVVFFVALLAVGFVSCEKDGSDPDNSGSNGGSGSGTAPSEQTVYYDMVDFKHQLGVLNYVAFTADNKIYNYFVDNGFSATVKCETNNLVDTNDLLIIQTQTADFKTTSEDTFTIVNGNSKIHFKPSTGAILREWHMLGRADIPKADVANEINHYAASASSKTYKFRLDE